MNTTLVERNLLLKDLDGHWYSIPAKLEDEFKSMREAIILADWGSEDWYQANDDFGDTFTQYMKGE